MKLFVVRISGGRLLLSEGDSIPTDCAKIRLDGGENGILIVGGKQLALDKDGALLFADQLTCGVHTPALFVHGKCYEGPALSVGGGYFSFLPPTHAQLTRLEERLQSLEAAHAELAKRICLIEGRLQDTNIF